MVFIFLSVSLIVYLVLRKPSRERLHPATDLYLRYCEGLSKQGLSRQRGETPLHYYNRLSAVKPAWSKQMREITELYISLVYKGTEPEHEARAILDFKHKIRQFHMLMY